MFKTKKTIKKLCRKANILEHTLSNNELITIGKLLLLVENVETPTPS